MEETSDAIPTSSEKLEANRRNAQLSTGPRTDNGKSRSRGNALKHGMLASSLLITEGEGAEDSTEFEELLGGLRRDFAPVGTLEDMLVQTIATCFWRKKRALKCEAGLVKREYHTFKELKDLADFGRTREHEAVVDHLSLPLGVDLDRIQRYETTIHRELANAINQLERLQRARKGEYVPVPVSLQVSNDG